METATRRWVVPLALALISAAGLAPFLFLLPVWPHSWDATVWIVRGASSTPGWADWVFKTSQFNVGYRPVTALSYTLDHALGGFASYPYRLTDLALHLSCVLLVYLLYRRLAPRLPFWGGLVAAGIYVAHPVVAEVVPHLARRSYSLASALSLAALWVLLPRGNSDPGWARTIVGASLSALAVLSNEAALVGVAALTLFAVGGGPSSDRYGRILRVAAVPALFASLTFVLRLIVVAGGVGGYEPEVDQVARIVRVTVVAWRTLTGASSAPLLVLAILASAYYLWRTWMPARSPGGHPRRGLYVPLLLWISTYLVLFGLLGVWFPRQAYFMLAPGSLLVGALLAETFARRAVIWNLIPQLALVGLVVVPSPLLHGLDPQRKAAWRKTDRVMRGMQAAIAELGLPAEVRFAIPQFTRKPPAGALRARPGFERPALPSRQVELWMSGLFAGRQVEVRSFMTYQRHPLRPGPAPEMIEVDGGWELRLPPELPFYSEAAAGRFESPDGVIHLRIGEAADVRAIPSYFYFDDGTSGTRVHLGTPEPGR